jgi:hypothetical protein
VKTISIDFDGVIHAYSHGWHDGSCYDMPMDGAIDAIKSLLETYCVFVLSTRDPSQIIAWFGKHAPEIPCGPVEDEEKFWDKPGIVGVTNRKLPAMVYIDDRGFLFVDWKQTMKWASDFAIWPKTKVGGTTA